MLMNEMNERVNAKYTFFLIFSSKLENYLLIKRAKYTKS